MSFILLLLQTSDGGYSEIDHATFANCAASCPVFEVWKAIYIPLIRSMWQQTIGHIKLEELRAIHTVPTVTGLLLLPWLFNQVLFKSDSLEQSSKDTIGGLESGVKRKHV
jgi:hypothetical protein